MGSPNVMIGNGGGGGGGGSGGGGEEKAETEAVEAKEGHKLDVKFDDKSGNPITGVKYDVKSPDNKKIEGVLTGDVKKTVEKEGDYEISLQAVKSAKWSKDKARHGDEVKMQVETAGIDDDTPADLEVWQRDGNRADKMIFAKADLTVKGGKVESDWTYEYEEEDVEEEEVTKIKGGFSSPKFYFIVKVNGITARSPMLDYKDYVEIKLETPEGEAAKDEAYQLFLANGEVRKGNLDPNGYAKEDKIPPGNCWVKFPDSGEVGSE